MKYLILDATNVLYRTYFAHQNGGDVEDISGLAVHSALITLNKHYTKHQPHKLVLCFDRHNWRKDYTASDDAITKKQYKGTRRKNMTEAEAKRYTLFCQHIEEFEIMMRDHTGVITLAADGLEADDLVAGVIQTMEVKDNNPSFVVISGDKDLIQLLGHDNTILIDPAKGKERTLEEWDGDAGLFMYEKCIRGDAGDNVQSARPRLKSTRLRKAYNDPYEHENLMREVWSDKDGTEFVVKKLFEENKKLMDLSAQPEDIRLKIVETVLRGFDNPGQFSYFHFMQYAGKHQLKKVADSADRYAKMLK